MEGSAPKRRKVSPTSNVPVDPAGPPSDASSSNSNPPASSDGAGGPRRRSPRLRRPSFASPTKASLARANPDILERRNAERQASVPPTASRPRSSADADMLTAQLEGASDPRPASDAADPRPADADAQLPSSAPLAPQSTFRRMSGRMVERPARRRSNNPKPSPRPLPRPSSKEEELLDPFKGRVLRRSPPPGVLPATELEEPELPPTPSDKGTAPIATRTPPGGIHSTPSKRPRKITALAERLRSSPLKQPPMKPGENSPLKLERSMSPTKMKSFRNVFKQSSVEADGQNSTTTLRSLRARGVKPIDPLAEKKTLRDSLLAEIALLQTDVDVATKENQRLYQLSQTRSDSPVSQKPENIEALLDVLRRHVLPPEKEPPPDPTQNWLEQALNPISFLPFGNPSSMFPSPFAPTEQPKADPPPPVSHHPIPMTAKEELPYLQLFTPLTFSSSMTLIPRSLDEIGNPTGPLLQRHAIAVHSAPPGLFAAQIEMTVNPKHLVIDDLSVPRLDPAAVAEVGPFIQRVLGGQTNSALRKNVGVVTWAMAEWTRLATKRARFWCAVDRELGDKESIARCVKRMRERRRRGGVGRDDEDEQNGVEGHLGDGRKSNFSKADLLPRLGKASLDLDLADVRETEAVNLRVEWKIEFDWTGEGQSRVGVLVGVPGKWHNQDNRGNLAAIPEMFDKMVREGGDPMDAVKTVVALLVGDIME